MERGSDKHGPRTDEMLKAETEAIERSGHEPRVEEWHEAEPSGEDEPAVNLIPNLGEGVLSADELERRSRFASYLSAAPYPADREQLIDTALDRHAPDAVLDLVRRLPDGQAFANVGEVWAALGGQHEQHRL